MLNWIRNLFAPRVVVTPQIVLNQYEINAAYLDRLLKAGRVITITGKPGEAKVNVPDWQRTYNCHDGNFDWAVGQNKRRLPHGAIVNGVWYVLFQWQGKDYLYAPQGHRKARFERILLAGK